ncbi:MAG: hypothetical protein IPM13_07070 [Phycisphaerales bacterium]|nr:hypothetical protein [Phycisphaerales bacterium]
MPIEFHCNHCNHLIRAGSEHAGKRGKCPHCKNSVYIPTPSEEIEIIPLAPIDPDEERRRKQGQEETRRITQTIRSERGEVPEVRRETVGEASGDVRLPVDVETLVLEYCLAMAGGKLDEAADFATEIRANRKRADEVISRLMMEELPPMKLSKIPRAVLMQFLKQLREGK